MENTLKYVYTKTKYWIFGRWKNQPEGQQRRDLIAATPRESQWRNEFSSNKINYYFVIKNTTHITNFKS